MICSEPFDDVYSYDDEGIYIVRRTVEGISKYGFLSYNGALFTGLVYDTGWKVVDSMDIPEGSTVMSSFGHIAVADGFETSIYDKDLNLLRKGEGFVRVIRDEVTGDAYMVTDNNDLLTVYSLPDMQELFSFEGNIHRLEATDGRFHCWDFGYFILLDSDGEEISRVKVKYGRSG